jgi:thiol-disulfide isomerase/thioredoxin
MKYLLSGIIIGLLTFAEARQTEYSDIYTAARTSSMTGKPIVFVVTQSNCPHCIEYWHRTLNEPTIQGILENHFEFAVSTIDKGGKIPSDLPAPRKTPTTYVVGSSGKILMEPIEGNLDAQGLYNVLYRVNEIAKTVRGR